MSKNQIDKKKPLKVIVVQLGRIGDTTLATPMFHAIAAEYPLAKIHVLVTRHGFPVLIGNPYLDKIIVHKKKPISFLFLICYFLFTRYDWWVDPKDHYSGEGSFFARISRARNKVGFNRPGKRIFTYQVASVAENFHYQAVERNLRSLIFMDIHADLPCKPELFPDPVIEQTMLHQYIDPLKRNMLINISAGSIHRLWPIENWSSMVQLCLYKGFKVLLSFKPADKEMAQYIKEMNPTIELVYSGSIREIIALMPHVDLVLTPDTSIVHIASSFNKPQVALYSDLDFNINNFRPLSDNSILVISKDGGNFNGISKDEVAKAIEKMDLALKLSVNS